MRTIHYRAADVNGLKIAYREAGRTDAPTLLLRDEKNHQHLLQTLAVIGREFSLSVLKAVVSKPEGRQTGDTAFRCDCLLERGGFEPPVSREGFPKENPSEYWRNFASKSVGVVRRTSSPSVRD